MNFERNPFEGGNLEKKESGIEKFKPNNHYTYVDNFDDRKVVFECDANNILEADELLKSATGIEAEKKIILLVALQKIILKQIQILINKDDVGILFFHSE